MTAEQGWEDRDEFTNGSPRDQCVRGVGGGERGERGDGARRGGGARLWRTTQGNPFGIVYPLPFTVVCK